MLKAIPGCETVQHLCEEMTVGSKREILSKPRNLGEIHGVEVFMHDIHPYLFIKETKKMITIHYCPYCGVDIDGEERP